MDSFSEPLNTHLHDEIGTLLALSKFGDSLDLIGIVEKEVQQVIGSLSKTAVMPAILLNNDVTFEGGMHANFPSIPGPVKWLLMHVFTLWHWRWWKYASSDTYGRPKVTEKVKH